MFYSWFYWQRCCNMEQHWLEFNDTTYIMYKYIRNNDLEYKLK